MQGSRNILTDAYVVSSVRDGGMAEEESTSSVCARLIQSSPPQ